MGRILNTTLYPFASPVSLDDYVIGTKNDNNKRTQNFKVSDLINLVDGTALENGIISGTIVWSGQGLTFIASDHVVVIGNQVYNIPGDLITLSTADPDDPRIDVIYASLEPTTGAVTFEVLVGTPAVNPSKPTLDDPNTQLELTFVDIPAGATTPGGISQELVYDEDAGEPTEWDATDTTISGGINLADPANPNTGTVSISINESSDGDRIDFVSASPMTLSDVSSLHFYVFSTGPSLGTSRSNRIEIQLFDGSDVASSIFWFSQGYNGFDASQDKEYQSVNVPMTEFSPATFSQTFDTIRFTFQGRLSDLLYIDTMNLVLGAVNPPQTQTFLGLSDVVDNNYTGKAGYVAQVNTTGTGMVLSPLTDVQQFQIIVPDAYLGNRYEPIDTSILGFYMGTNTNQRNGVDVYNTSTGGNATCGFAASNDATPFSNAVSLQMFGTNYATAALANKGGLFCFNNIAHAIVDGNSYEWYISNTSLLSAVQQRMVLSPFGLRLPNTSVSDTDSLDGKAVIYKEWFYANGMRVVEVDVDSTAIQAADTVDQLLVAAPGADTYISVVYSDMILFAGGSAYNNVDARLGLNSGANRTIIGTGTGFLADASDVVNPVAMASIKRDLTGASTIVNQGLYLSLSAASGAGDGTLRIVIAYFERSSV